MKEYKYKNFSSDFFWVLSPIVGEQSTGSLHTYGCKSNRADAVHGRTTVNSCGGEALTLGTAENGDMGNSNDGSSDGARRDASKVERVIERYGLVGHGDRLVASWLGEDSEQRSTRELAAWFNREVLRAAIRDADLDVLPGDVENLHRLLTDDDVSPGDRTEAVMRLERAGVDVEDVRDDFVSHQTIYNYLTDERRVERSTDAPDVETARARVQRLTGRVRAVTTSTLESLIDAGAVSLGSFDVTVRVTVYCEDCGRNFSFREVVERGTCACDSPE